MNKTTKNGIALVLALLLGLAPIRPQADTALALSLEEPTAAALRITELMHKNKATLRDEDGDFSDWIELENASDAALELSGWRLGDDTDKAGWALPAWTLEPGERLLIFADGKDRSVGELHTDFSLSEGELLCLRAPDGQLSDTALCAGNTADAALARQEDGSFLESRYPTPGYPNTAGGYDAWQESQVPSGPLVISEAAVFERRARFASLYGVFDWVEIKNISTETVDLGGWCLSDDGDEPSLWRFPERKLDAGQCLLLCCSDEAEPARSRADICTGFSLNAEAEQLYLTAPDGTLTDYASLRDIPYYGSYGRMDGRAGWFYFEEPTPGQDNEAGRRRVSRRPVSLIPDGVLEGVQNATVWLEAEGDIYYTLDGSLPTRESQRYEGPFVLEETAVVRAVAIEEDGIRSPALTLSYLINEGHSLPVLSLVTDSPSGFREMYTMAEKGRDEIGNLALYEKDGGFSIPCEVRLNGETSLTLMKKNMSVRFRRAYGAARLEYDCFDGGVSGFTNLLLRSGQDYAGAIMRNELCCMLAEQATDSVLVQRCKYCVLYVNGEYFGIYALMEKANEQMFADHTGVSRDSVTVYEASVHENTDLYREVISPILTTDMRVEENYLAVCERLDIGSLIDWILLEGWTGNKDLQSGNLRYGRSTENDGKWRLMFYDLDATFSGTENCFDLLATYSTQTRQIGQMIQALLKNDDFRASLFTRAAELLNGPLSNDALVAEIDRLAAELDPEVERNHAMMGMEKKSWLWNVDLLRKRIVEEDWAQRCIDALCRNAKASDEERALYFGNQVGYHG